MNIKMSGWGKIVIDGISHEGTDIVIEDGKMSIDGKRSTVGNLHSTSITVYGNVTNLESVHQEVKVTGNVGNISTTHGAINVHGIVYGNVEPSFHKKVNINE